MYKSQLDANYKHEQVILFLLLAVLGIIAALTHVHIPHTEVLIDGRWVFGFLGFALLRQWWVAFALGALLSYPYGTDISFWVGFCGNMLYAVPSLLLIRPLSNRMQNRWGPGWRLWLGWSALVLACYQAFITPMIWAIIALMKHRSVWLHVLEGWQTQPFLVESILVALFSATAMVALVALKQLRAEQRRLSHINRILLGIRNVNQLIVTEDDPQNLVARACVNLTETMGYLNAWIALIGREAGRSLGLPAEKYVSATAAAGFDGGFEILRERLERGQFPKCMKRAMESEDVLVVGDPAADCPDCPLHGEYGGRSGLVRRLDFDGVTYGILTASVPAAYARDAEDRDLFNEVAGDLAFALHKIASARNLEESRLHVGLVVEGSGIGTWEWNVQTNETLFNEQWAAMLGYTIEELTPYDYATWERLVHPEDLEQARLALVDCVEGRTTDYSCEFRMRHKEGSWVWILDRGRVMVLDDAGKALSMFGTHTNITDLKQTEEAVRKEHELSESLIEDGPVGIVKVNRDGEIVFANSHAKQVFGLQVSDIQGRGYNAPDWQITAVDGSPFPDDELPFRRVMATGRAVYDVQHTIIRGDGARSILSINGAPLHDAQRQIDGVVFAILDITERRQQEERIAILSRMIDAAPACITIHDTDGRFVFANAKNVKLHGYDSLDEFLRVNLHELDVPESEALLAGRFRKIAEEGEARFEVSHYRKDGSTFPLEVLAKQIDWEGRPAILSIATDITERKTAENTLRESERRVRTKLNALLDPEGDIGTLKLSDMMDCDEIQSLMNDFHALTDIGVGIIDLDGNVLVGTGWQDVCTEFHRVHPETAKRCIESDTALASGVEPGTFKIYKCKNNLWDMVTPIVIGGKHIGNLFLGQFFFEDEAPDIATFREQAHRYGFDEDAYLKAYRAIPRWSRETVDRVMTFYCNLINVISCLSYAHIKLAQTTEALRSANTKLSIAMQAAREGLWEWNLLTDSIHFDDASLEMLGYQREDIRGPMESGTWWVGQVHPEDKVFMEERFNRYISGKEKDYRVECRLKNKGGGYLWVESSAKLISKDPAGKPEIVVGIHQDISQRKMIEHDLIRSEKSYRDIFDNSSDCIFIHDAATGVIVDVNRTTCETFGYSPGEIKKLEVGDFSLNEPPYTNAEAVEWIKKTHTEGPQRFEWLAKNREGRLIWFENTLIHAQIGEKDRILVFGRNITSQKRVEQELRESEEHFRFLVDHSYDLIWTLKADAVFTYVSPSWKTRLGYEPSSIVGKVFQPLVHPDDVTACEEYMSRVLNTQGALPGPQYRVRHADGSWRWHEAVMTPTYAEDGSFISFVGVSRDISDRKRAEAEHEKLQAQLQQAQKMEAVGRLAGGVAHDFNNMLGVIIGHADMILEEMDPEQPSYANLTEIRKAGSRSADLTRQLLAFARKQTVSPKVIDLNKAVGGMLKMLQRLIGEDIDLAWIPTEKVWPVKIDPGQVDQVLANLCVNARDAINGVGKMTIETGNTVLDEDYCKDHVGFVPGEYAMLAVSDNGCGMDSETLAHLFEPFFTTKEPGKGTGLGLATVYGVVKQNSGLINVYSEPGQGTTFKVYLPRHKAKTTPLPEKRPDNLSERSHETILLVEDEPAILGMTTMMLERQGYTVVGAGTPGEAIRLATEHAGDIHLLMTDVVMPEMNGRDLAKNILSLYPHLKCLFMSGYTADVIAHHGVLDEGVNFIQKPFSSRGLAVKIREVLDRSPDETQG